MRNIFWSKNFKLSTATEHEEPHHRQAPWPPRSSKIKVARSCDASYRCWPISRERNVLETPKLVGRLPTPQAIMHTSFKVKAQGHDVTWCVWQMLPHKLRTKSLRNTEIDRKVAHPTGNIAHQFQGQKLKDQGHQADWLWDRCVSYVPNWKGYKVQPWYKDGARRLVSPTSTMTSKVKG